MDKENNKHESPKEESFPTASLPDLSAILGDQIGPYTLLSILGEGGFGIVYLAEQKHPIKRQVALKLIKPGMDSRQIVARFDAERQALALLDHPNIAHIFEAGSIEPGKPYFVMEYIKGLPITEYCDHHQLKIEERLKLFIQICDAVGYANQKGIIHRDIKPSNIIVTVQEGKAVPKVIDFGVAKAISMPLTEKNIFTQQGQLLGTPEYMSPEQADLKEKDIDIRTDVYSLGVVLYELLTGALPFEPRTLREAGYAAIQRIIREQNPPRPSTKLSSLGENAKKVAQNRLTEVSTLVKSLQKELEWIPLMAIRKERQLRYQTASELAQDIQNYMEGHPLKAGPESSMYRFKKFIKKHKGLVAAVGLIAAILITGLIVSSFLYIQTEQARKQALVEKVRAQKELKISQTVLDFINNDLFSSINPENSGGQKVSIKSVLDTAYAGLTNKYQDAPLAKASIYYTLGITYRNWGYYDSAELNYINSLTIRQKELGPEHPDTLDAMCGLALTYHEQGHYGKAERLYSEALTLQKQVLGPEHPDTLNAMCDLASVYDSLGYCDRAEKLYTESLEIRKRIQGPEHRSYLTTMNNLASTYHRHGYYDKAEQLFTETLEKRKRVLGPEHPETLNTMHNLAIVYGSQGCYDKAEQLASETLEKRKRVLGLEHPDTLHTMSNLASIYRNQSHYNKAEQLAAETLDIRKRVLGPEHPDTLSAMHNLAIVYYSRGYYDKAEQLAIETLEKRKRVLWPEHPDTLRTMSTLANVYHNQSCYDKAEQLDIEILAIQKRVLGPEHPDTLLTMDNLAIVYCSRGYYEKAEQLAIETLEKLKRVLGPEHPNTVKTMNNLVNLYKKMGNEEKAKEWQTKIESIGNKTSIDRGEVVP